MATKGNKSKSWNIIDDTTAINTCNMSFFEHKGITLPVELHEFFDAQKLENGENKFSTIHYNDADYKLRVTKETLNKNRVRIFWYNDLKQQLLEYKDTENVCAQYQKKAIGYFDLKMLVDDYAKHYHIEKTVPVGAVDETIKISKVDTMLDQLNQMKIDEETIFIDDFSYSFKQKPKPEKKTNEDVSIYPRNHTVAINALAHAHFQCECDPTHITFTRKIDGKPYMEAHHLIPMAYQDDFEYSLDIEENIVSLCSHCHNEIHYGQNAKQLVEKLYLDRKEALRKAGIDVSLNQLLEYYM